MPISINDKKYYWFDYRKFFIYLKSLFKEKSIKSYLDKWHCLILKLDELCNDELTIYKNTYYGLGEYFEQIIDFNEISQSYTLHYNIEYILDKHKTDNTESIDINTFLKNVIYNTDEPPIYSKKNTPLIVVPSKSKNTSFMLIDGNKRFNYMIKNNIRNVEYLVIQPKFSEFIFSCDWAIYSILREINFLLEAISKNESIKKYRKELFLNINDPINVFSVARNRVYSNFPDK